MVIVRYMYSCWLKLKLALLKYSKNQKVIISVSLFFYHTCITYSCITFVFMKKCQYMFCFKIHVFWGHSCIVFFSLLSNLFCISPTCNQGKGSLFKRNEWKEAFHSKVQKFPMFPVEANFCLLLFQSALHLKSFFFFAFALIYLLVFSSLVHFLLKS